MRRSYQWVTTQAKTIERKNLNKYGKSLSFTGIQGLLSEANIEIQDRVLLVDKEKYQEIKANLLKS